MSAFYDTVILGAGPAGSMLAMQLARNGRKTLLLDLRRPEQEHVCGGFLGPEIPAIWQANGLGERFKKLNPHPIWEALVTYGERFRLRRTFTEGPGFGIDRDEYNRELNLCAADAGAEVLLGSTCSIEKAERGFWRLTISRQGISHEIKTKYWVKANGRRPPPKNGPPAYFSFKTLYENVREEAVALHFVRNGHVGLNPLGRGRVTMCSYASGDYLKRYGGDRDGLMNDFMSQNVALRESLVNAKRTGKWSACVAEPDRHRVFFSDGVFYAGDAVSMVNPIVGGGISVAMAGGSLLAEELIQGGSEREIARRYEKRWNAFFYRLWKRASWIGDLERSEKVTRSFFNLMNKAPFIYGFLLKRSRLPVKRVLA